MLGRLLLVRHCESSGLQPDAPLTARGRQAIDALRRREARLAVVATHGNLMTLILNSIDPHFGFAGWESLAHPDVYVVEVAGDRWSCHRLARGDAADATP